METCGKENCDKPAAYQLTLLTVGKQIRFCRDHATEVAVIITETLKIFKELKSGNHDTPRIP